MDAILLLAALSTAPCVLWTALPEENIVAVTSPGDVNGNGTADVVAAAGCPSGGLWCVDGRTGAALWTADLPGAYDCDCLCGVPDLDGDLIGDAVVAACDGVPPCQGLVLAVSGADGHVLWETETDPDGYLLAVAFSAGPPGSVPVIHATDRVGDFSYFLTLDGTNGDTLWSIAHATLDPGIHTMADFSGNGWGEMGYSVDRGSAYSGFCRVHDALTGVQLFAVSSWYYGRMDLCDSPAPMIAVGQWGNTTPDLRLMTLPDGTLQYGLPESQVIYQSIRFVRGVTGGTVPSPVLAGWSGTHLNLVFGTSGEVGDVCDYDAGIVELAGCQMGPLDWKLAVLTGSSLYLTEPALYGGSTGSSVALPSSGTDLCLLPSDQYPSPLAAAGMQGSGPGLCVLVTSWPEGAGEVQPPLPCGVALVSNPSPGGLRLLAEPGGASVTVLDVAGRAVVSLDLSGEGEAYVPLPPGVYLVMDRTRDHAPLRAVVLGTP